MLKEKSESLDAKQLNLLLAGALAASATLGLCACDDETTGASDSQTMSVLDAGKTLGGCSKDNAGEMVYVSDSSAVYYCAEGKWQTLNGKDGKDGKNGKDGSNGKDGANGKDGVNGVDGKDGKDGKDGENGSSGLSTKDTVVIRDTIVVNNRDTVVVNNRDTVVVNKRDTVVVINRDTVVVKEQSSGGSSSSVISSSVNSSSSSAIVVSGNSFRDSRDGRVYKTVRIGLQEWMAENMKLDINDSYCYNDIKENCEKYGMFYTATTAKRVCPDGWNLPQKNDWIELDDYLYKKGISKIKSMTGWNSNNGTNEFGFSAYPAGLLKDGVFVDFGNTAYFSGGSCANITGNSLTLGGCGDNASNAMPVRCLRKLRCDEIMEDCFSDQGILTDERDGHSYKIQKIGYQVWMAENLAYHYEILWGRGTYYFADSLNDYGYYYSWAAAMDSAGVFGVNGKGCGYEGSGCRATYPVRGICPEGWHLPSDRDWRILFRTVNDSANAMQAVGYAAWPNATNISGFSALPAGFIYGTGDRGSVGESAEFWSATGSDSRQARSWHISAAGLFNNAKYFGYSVRCLKD